MLESQIRILDNEESIFSAIVCDLQAFVSNNSSVDTLEDIGNRLIEHLHSLDLESLESVIKSVMNQSDTRL
jgi:hypothetical protein